MDTSPRLEGKITEITTQKKDPLRVSIFLDGEFAFGLHRDLLFEYGIHIEQQLDSATVKKLIQKDARKRALQSALHFLGHRARTQKEIITKLRKKGFDEDVVQYAIGRLKEINYIDDVSFTTAFIEGRFKSKKYGPGRIKRDLIRLGIDPEMAETSLNELIQEEDEKVAALDLAKKRWKRLRKEQNPLKKKKKLTDYLMRKGYTYTIIGPIIRYLESESNE